MTFEKQTDTYTVPKTGEQKFCFNKDAASMIPAGNYKLQLSFTPDNQDLFNDSETYNTEGITIDDVVDIEVVDLIVGHRMNLDADQKIVPFTTTATSESSITTNEKIKTKFNFTIKAYDSTTGNTVSGVKFSIRFGINVNDDIYNMDYSDEQQNELYDLYTNALDIGLASKTTNSSGSCTWSGITFGEIFGNVSPTVYPWCCIYIRCEGTTTRTTNMIPITVITPLLSGTQPMKFNTDFGNYVTDSNGVNAPICMGGGGLLIDERLHYSWVFGNDTWTFRGDYHEAFDKNHVITGKGSSEYFYVEEKDLLNDAWSKVPYERLKNVDGENNVFSVNGSGAVKVGTGGCKFIYINDKDYDETGKMYIRMSYTGAVGARQSRVGNTHTLTLNPSNPTEYIADTILTLYEYADSVDEINVFLNEDTSVKLLLQRAFDKRGLTNMLKYITYTIEEVD